MKNQPDSYITPRALAALTAASVIVAAFASSFPPLLQATPPAAVARALMVNPTNGVLLTPGFYTNNPVPLGSTTVTSQLPVTNGGTGASTAAAGRTNLAVPGLVTENTFPSRQTVPSVRSGIDAIDPPMVFITAGDSISASDQWQTKLAAASPTIGASTMFNTAVGGRVAQDCIDGFTAEVTPHAPSGGAIGWFGIWVGSNDIALNTGTAAQIYAKLKTLWSLGHGINCKVLAFTVMKRAGQSGADLTKLNDLNTLILSDRTLYDELARPDLWLGDPDGPLGPQLFADGVHPTAYGQAIVANRLSGLLDLKRPVPLDAEFPRFILPRLSTVNFGSAMVDAANGGSVDTARSRIELGVGTPANSWALAQLMDGVAAVPSTGNGTDWSHTIAIAWTEYYGQLADQTFRLTLSYASNTPGTLTGKGVGMEISASGARIIVHDGTTLTNGSYSGAIANGSVRRDWLLVSRPGIVELYVAFNGQNPKLILTQTTGTPLGYGPLFAQYLQVSLENSAIIPYTCIWQSTGMHVFVHQ